MSASPETTFPASGLRTHRGGCQCGAVRFEADFDLAAGTTRCNCTVCTRTQWWGASMKPDAFRLVSGAEVLGDYSVSEAAHSRFCRRCGIRVFSHGHVPELGGDYYTVNLHCLDEVELTGVPVTYLDGRHDTWETLAERPYVSPFAPQG